ncbi:MAG: 16S rRNA (cytidine(1402)-2'-O)-methyltransferase [Candidatus Omnitrophota bacterium]
MPGTLYIVATPIGNLSDITFRAVETLKTADLIACEDTRHTKILLDRYSIDTPTVSYFEHNKVRRGEQLLRMLNDGKNIALVSDAGTPGISDPGSAIIRSCIDRGIRVIPIPGPSALLTALAASGKPTHKFVYEGFLSNKSTARRKRLEVLKTEERTVVLYESPHRLLKLLADILEIYGDVKIVCARELTKKFEEIRREPVSAALEHFNSNKVRGEFIIII